MSHSHHYHEYHHHHSENLQGKRLLCVTFLNLSITIVQIMGGVISNSLSLLSDAVHNLGDSSAVFIAFIAGKISRRKPDMRYSFGYKRANILAAMFNAVVLIAICIVLFVESVQRFVHPQEVHGRLMLIVASFGLLANLLSVLILNRDKNQNLNVKVAYLHLLGDTLSSVAVIAGGVAVWLFGLVWLDQLVTLGLAVYIATHTWSVLKETIDILMQAMPQNINLEEINSQIERLEELDNIHHVHVWKLDDNQTHLEAHLNFKNNIDLATMMGFRENVERILHEKFGIQHITLQAGYNCCCSNKLLVNNI